MSMNSPCQDLKPWTELQELLLPLSQRQYQALRDSIEEDGQQVPILALADGRVVDGWHRFQVSREHGLAPKVHTLELEDAAAFRLGLNLNTARRQLSPEQLSELREWQKKQYLMLRRQGKTQAVASSLVGIARQTGDSWESQSGHKAEGSSASLPDLRVKVPPKARLELKRRVDAGQPLRQVAADFSITPRHARRIVNSETPSPPLPASGEERADGGILNGDMEVLNAVLADDTVAMFATDPPYGRDYINQYGRLAQMARRKLKPGSLCLAYSGHFYLPQIFSEMLKYLEYWWLFGFPLTGQHPAAWPRKVWVGWRPVLVMARPPVSERQGSWALDFPPGGSRDKVLHPWQQNIEPVRYWIERLTEPGDLVVDPFCGTGTVGVACRLLGRRFLGAEIDPQTAALARQRLGEIKEAERTGQFLG